MEGVMNHKIASDCPCDECQAQRVASRELRREHARQQMAGVHLAKEIMSIPDDEWQDYQFRLKGLARDLLGPR